MLWGAPMCFLFQARPVKMWTKIIFYMLSNPPGVIASLLPAPEQAILNANLEKSFAALYRPVEEGDKEKAGKTPRKSLIAKREQGEVEEDADENEEVEGGDSKDADADDDDEDSDEE
jgi:hypothetical protein